MQSTVLYPPLHTLFGIQSEDTCCTPAGHLSSSQFVLFAIALMLEGIEDETSHSLLTWPKANQSPEWLVLRAITNKPHLYSTVWVEWSVQLFLSKKSKQLGFSVEVHLLHTLTVFANGAFENKKMATGPWPQNVSVHVEAFGPFCFVWTTSRLHKTLFINNKMDSGVGGIGSVGGRGIGGIERNITGQ